MKEQIDIPHDSIYNYIYRQTSVQIFLSCVGRFFLYFYMINKDTIFDNNWIKIASKKGQKTTMFMVPC